MENLSNRSAFLKLIEVVDREGIRAGVIYLNSLTAHRFTSLYRFDRDILHNLYFFDRENPLIESSDEIPIISSYCVFIRNTAKPFKTDDSSSDPAVQNHPKKLTIQAYCGVPLIDRDGKMFGTVCHFDVKPVVTDVKQVELLERVADVLLHRVRDAK